MMTTDIHIKLKICRQMRLFCAVELTCIMSGKAEVGSSAWPMSETLAKSIFKVDSQWAYAHPGDNLDNTPWSLDN